MSRFIIVMAGVMEGRVLMMMSWRLGNLGQIYRVVACSSEQQPFNAVHVLYYFLYSFCRAFATIILFNMKFKHTAYAQWTCRWYVHTMIGFFDLAGCGR